MVPIHIRIILDFFTPSCFTGTTGDVFLKRIILVALITLHDDLNDYIFITMQVFVALFSIVVMQSCFLFTVSIASAYQTADMNLPYYHFANKVWVNHLYQYDGYLKQNIIRTIFT